MNIKEILSDKSTRYFQHPKGFAKIYVEIERDDNGKPITFITHSPSRADRERIDGRSHYDKQDHNDWKVLTQSEVDTITGVNSPKVDFTPQVSSKIVKPIEVHNKTKLVSVPILHADGSKTMKVEEVIKSVDA
jgi:hypothetical protein